MTQSGDYFIVVSAFCAKKSRPAFAARQQPLPPSGDQSFEDKLKQFLTSSEGKMADLNRSIDGKRGGGRRRK